jgi:hypothetical protein
MARGDRMNAALTKRIQTSQRTLTIHYPPVKTAATGIAPGAAPLKPLTGDPPPQLFIDTSTETPVKPSKTMPCLWSDSFHTIKTRTSTALAKSNREFGSIGWVEGAEALARVLLTDAAVDPNDLNGPTVFSEILYLESAGRRYKVLGEDRISKGFTDAISCYVWLMGAEAQ